MRGIGLASVLGSLLVLAGCGADNESEASKLQNATGAAPATDVKGAGVPAQASSLDQYAKRQQEERSQDPKKSEYGKGVGGGGRR